MSNALQTNDAAREHFEQGVQAYASGALEDSLDHFTHAIGADDSFHKAYMSRGAALLRLKRPGDARADFDRALDLEPDNSRTHHLRGLSHAQQGHDDQALTDFNRAIELDPEYGAAYHSRSTIQNRLGNNEAAMEDIQTYTHLTEKQVQEFSDEHNIWRSRQLHLEAENIADVMNR